MQHLSLRSRIVKKYLIAEGGKKWRRYLLHTNREVLKPLKMFFLTFPSPHALGVLCVITGLSALRSILYTKILGVRWRCSIVIPIRRWEKGGIAHVHGIVRRTYPKKSDFSFVSVKERLVVPAKHTTIPRKCRGYATILERILETRERAPSWGRVNLPI